MNTTEKVKTGALLAGGYVLGRTKKGRLALTTAMWLTGTSARVSPQQLVRQGLVGLAQSPQGAELVQQLRGPVAQAAQKAALATVTSQASLLTDALAERNAALSGGSQDGQQESSASTSAGQSESSEQEQPSESDADDQQSEAGAQEQQSESSEREQESEPTAQEEPSTPSEDGQAPPAAADDGGGGERSEQGPQGRRGSDRSSSPDRRPQQRPSSERGAA